MNAFILDEWKCNSIYLAFQFFTGKKAFTEVRMDIRNIEIDLVIAHEVVRAKNVAGERPPILSNEPSTLDAEGDDLVGQRLVSAVSSGSHCVEVVVDDYSVGSPFDLITSLLGSDDTAFVDRTKRLAKMLSTAQSAGPIKAGSALFLRGNCVSDNSVRRFVAVVKADPDKAFTKYINDNGSIVLYIKETLMGQSQRLIKVAFFLEEATPEQPATLGKVRKPEDFSIVVFDHMMQNSGDAKAALYFYSSFLKCRLAEKAAYLTKRFYDTTRDYINSRKWPQEEKKEYRADLVSYLRSNKQTIEPRQFAKDVFPVEEEDNFVEACDKAKVNFAFTKDTALVKSKLRRQSIKFTSDVTIVASPETLRDSVKIKEVRNDGWTEIEIKGAVQETK